MLTAFLEKTKAQTKALGIAVNQKSFWAIQYFSKNTDLLLAFVRGKKGLQEDDLLLLMVQPGLNEPMKSGELGRIFKDNQTLFPLVYLDARCPVALLDEASKRLRNCKLLQLIRHIKNREASKITTDPSANDSKWLALCAASCSQPKALKRFYDIWAEGTRKVKRTPEHKALFLDKIIRLSIYSMDVAVLAFAWEKLVELDTDLTNANSYFKIAETSFRKGEKVLDLNAEQNQVDRLVQKYIKNSAMYPYCQYLAKVYQRFYWRFLSGVYAAPSAPTLDIFRKCLGGVQRSCGLHYGKASFDGEALIEDDDEAIVGTEGDGERKGDSSSGSASSEGSGDSGSSEGKAKGTDSEPKGNDREKGKGDKPVGKGVRMAKDKTGAEDTTCTSSTIDNPTGTKSKSIGKGKDKDKATSTSATTTTASTAPTKAFDTTAAASTNSDAAAQSTTKEFNLLYYIITAVVGVVVISGLLASYFLLRTKDTPDLQDPEEQDGEEQEESQKKGGPQNLA